MIQSNANMIEDPINCLQNRCQELRALILMFIKCDCPEMIGRQFCASNLAYLRSIAAFSAMAYKTEDRWVDCCIGMMLESTT